MAIEDYHNLAYWADDCDEAETQYAEEQAEIMSNKPENVKCPDCDGEMIPRNSQFGKFWGCKLYPACKGTRDSMGRSKADREVWKIEQNKEVELQDVPVESGELISFNKKR